MQSEGSRFKKIAVVVLRVVLYGLLAMLVVSVVHTWRDISELINDPEFKSNLADHSTWVDASEEDLAEISEEDERLLEDAKEMIQQSLTTMDQTIVNYEEFLEYDPGASPEELALVIAMRSEHQLVSDKFDEMVAIDGHSIDDYRALQRAQREISDSMLRLNSLAQQFVELLQQRENPPEMVPYLPNSEA